MARFSACGLAVQPSPRPWVAAIPFGNIVWENGAPVPYSQPLCSGEGGSPDWVSTGSDRPGDDPTRCSFAGTQARRYMFEGVITALCRSDARDRKSVVQGKSVYVRVDLGGRRLIKTKNQRAFYVIETSQSLNRAPTPSI